MRSDSSHRHCQTASGHVIGLHLSHPAPCNGLHPDSYAITGLGHVNRKDALREEVLMRVWEGGRVGVC